MQLNEMYGQVKRDGQEVLLNSHNGIQNFSVESNTSESVNSMVTPPKKEIQNLVINIDRNGLVYFVSNGVLCLYKKRIEDFIGKHIIGINESIGIFDHSWFYEVFSDCFAKSTLEINGKWYLWKYEVKFDLEGNIDGVIALGKEINHESRFNNYLLYDKYYDSLTKLLNKKGLTERIEGLKNVKRAVCFFIDIWGFTKINNFYGNKVSDDIVALVAKELVDFADDNCIISRFSEDRFVVLCLNEKACGFVINNQIDRLKEILVTTYNRNGLSITIDKRIGYAIYPEDTQKLDKLVSLSNLAMNESFKNGKIDIVRYVKPMSSRLEKNIVIASKLKKAIEDELIQVHFQKVIDANDNHVVLLEQLARWTDKDIGYISPMEFFCVAKEANLLDTLERYLVDKAFCAFSKFSSDYEGANLSINITPCSLLDPKFIYYINDTAKKYNIKQSNICIEISESTFVNSIELCVDKINQFKEHDYLIALDDFGKEYSSLSILDRVDFDIIKIDASFVDKISHFKNIEIIRMIRRIAKISNKEIIAEGVETDLQKNALKKLGCFLQQGFLFHRPEFMA